MSNFSYPRSPAPGLRGLIQAAAVALALLMAPLSLWARDIVLGQIGPFTGLATPDAAEVNQGIKAYLAQARKSGALKGHNLALFELDDRNTAYGFVEQFGKAIEHGPMVLLSPIGSPALKRMLDDKLLETSDVVVMNAIPGTESIRSPGHPKLFHLRAGDKQQIEKLVNHARTLAMSRLSVLYQDLPIGTSGMAVAQAEAARVGGLELNGVRTSADAEDLAAASQRVAGMSVQGVLVVGDPRFMAEAVAALRKAGNNRAIFVLSGVPAPLIVQLAGAEKARGVGIAQVFPNPNGRTLPLHREFQSAMKAAFPELQEYTPFQLEGYVCARVLVEALKRDAEREPTPAGLAKTLHTMGKVDLGGFSVDFSNGNAGSSFVDIGVIDSGGRLRY